jgi:hypothetical protein
MRPRTKLNLCSLKGLPPVSPARSLQIGNGCRQAGETLNLRAQQARRAMPNNARHRPAGLNLRYEETSHGESAGRVHSPVWAHLFLRASSPGARRVRFLFTIPSGLHGLCPAVFPRRCRWP